MRRETIAIHEGYDGDPTTKAVAVPIYQTVAFEFDNAEHGAALFNNDVVGNIYSRIGNPTNAVLEKRVAALEGGVEALSVSSGMSAIEYAVNNITEAGNNIVSLSQLYGATYTLFEHIFPKRGVCCRFAKCDHPDAVEKLIDENTRAVYCESVGNPAGNVADIEGLANVAHKHGVPLIVDNTVATPILLRPIEYGADIVVHSMTKFMGGHGTTIGGMIVDSGKFPWNDYPDRYYMLTKPEPCYHGLVYTEHFGAAAYVARCRTVWPAKHRGGVVALQRILTASGHRDHGFAGGTSCGKCPERSGVSARPSHGGLGQLCGIPGQPFVSHGQQVLGIEGLLPADVWSERRL